MTYTISSRMTQTWHCPYTHILKQAYHAVQDAGWTSHLHCIHSHVDVSMNEFVDSFAICAHSHDSPSVILRRSFQAPLPLHIISMLRHREPLLLLGTSPPSVPRGKFTRVEYTLVSYLQRDCAYTREALHRIKRGDDCSCTSSGTVEGLYRVLFSCQQNQ